MMKSRSKNDFSKGRIGVLLLCFVSSACAHGSAQISTRNDDMKSSPLLNESKSGVLLEANRFRDKNNRNGAMLLSRRNAAETYSLQVAPPKNSASSSSSAASPFVSSFSNFSVYHPSPRKLASIGSDGNPAERVRRNRNERKDKNTTTCRKSFHEKAPRDGELQHCHAAGSSMSRSDTCLNVGNNKSTTLSLTDALALLKAKRTTARKQNKEIEMPSKLTKKYGKDRSLQLKWGTESPPYIPHVLWETALLFDQLPTVHLTMQDLDDGFYLEEDVYYTIEQDYYTIKQGSGKGIDNSESANLEKHSPTSSVEKEVEKPTAAKDNPRCKKKPRCKFSKIFSKSLRLPILPEAEESTSRDEESTSGSFVTDEESTGGLFFLTPEEMYLLSDENLKRRNEFPVTEL